jgi:hypothetical protein
VETRAIPADVPEMARTGLERLRCTAGSQAVFAAFVLDARRHLAHVYTVGDASAVVHGGARGERGTAVAMDPAGRWSTHGAPALGLRVDRYAGVNAVVVRSDGARGWGDVLPGDGAEAEFRVAAEELAGYDDVSFVMATAEGAGATGPVTLEATTTVARLPGAQDEPVPAAAPAPLPVPAAVPTPLPVAVPVPRGRAEPAEPAGLFQADPSTRSGPGRAIPPRKPLPRRVLATAAVMVLGLTAGTGAGAWWRARGVEPHSPAEEPAFPITFVRPSVPPVAGYPPLVGTVTTEEGEKDEPAAPTTPAVTAPALDPFAVPGGHEPGHVAARDPGPPVVPPKHRGDSAGPAASPRGGVRDDLPLPYGDRRGARVRESPHNPARQGGSGGRRTPERNARGAEEKGEGKRRNAPAENRPPGDARPTQPPAPPAERPSPSVTVPDPPPPPEPEAEGTPGRLERRGGR